MRTRPLFPAGPTTADRATCLPRRPRRRRDRRTRGGAAFGAAFEAFEANGVAAGTGRYGATAVIVSEAAVRLAVGGVPAGGSAPSMAVGAEDFLRSLEPHEVGWQVARTASCPRRASRPCLRCGDTFRDRCHARRPVGVDHLHHVLAVPPGGEDRQHLVAGGEFGDVPVLP